MKNNKITDEIVYVDASEEEKFNIAATGYQLKQGRSFFRQTSGCQNQRRSGDCRSDSVDLIDVAPNQFISVATAFIPFL